MKRTLKIFKDHTEEYGATVFTRGKNSASNLNPNWLTKGTDITNFISNQKAKMITLASTLAS